MDKSGRMGIKVKFNSSIFREYDIRGVASKGLSAEFSEALGLPYTQLLRGRLKSYTFSRRLYQPRVNY